MEQPHLLALIRRKVLEKLKGYLQVPEIVKHIEDYIVRPALGKRSGVLGAIALAQQLAESGDSGIVQPRLFS